MERTYEHRGITYTIDVRTQPGRRFQWSFQTSNGLSGKSASPVSVNGLEGTFWAGSRAAVEAIDRSLVVE